MNGEDGEEGVRGRSLLWCGEGSSPKKWTSKSPRKAKNTTEVGSKVRCRCGCGVVVVVCGFCVVHKRHVTSMTVLDNSGHCGRSGLS